MSSDAAEDGSFEAQLEAMLERYRRRNIAKQLENIATRMEETLLQRALAAGFFEELIEIDSDARERVRTARAALEAENYSEVEEQLETLRDSVGRAHTKVGNEIQELRFETLSIITAMERLNERVDRVNSERLAALSWLVDDWEWREHVSNDESTSFEVRRTEARQVGVEMRETFEELRDDLFDPYKETDVWPLVEALLDDEALRYDDLSAEEREQLVASDLGSYVELSLS
jgi:hypothetical protein